MHAGFLTLDAPRWTEVLAKLRHDFHHLPGYVVLTAEQEHGAAIAFLAEDGQQRFLMPLILRPIDPELTNGERFFDVTCPYGYPGPLVSHGAAGDFVERAIAALVEGLNERGVIAAFSRLHPLLPLPMAPFDHIGQLVQHGETVSIDLTRTEEEMWRHVRPNHRRDINQARRNGHTARVDETWEHFDAFVAIYHQTMQRLGAQDFYHFSRDDLLRLRSILGAHLHLAIVEIDGQVAGAGLVTETCGIMQNHLSGTRTEFLDASPEKLRLDFMRKWGKVRGNRVFHLGGGLGGRPDALFHFKAGFSDCRHPFWTWRLVTNPSVYGQAVATWQDRFGIPADDLTGFFPAYRKPVAPGAVGDEDGPAS
jgi:hypothetical protein